MSVSKFSSSKQNILMSVTGFSPTQIQTNINRAIEDEKQRTGLCENRIEEIEFLMLVVEMLWGFDHCRSKM